MSCAPPGPPAPCGLPAGINCVHPCDHERYTTAERYAAGYTAAVPAKFGRQYWLDKHCQQGEGVGKGTAGLRRIPTRTTTKWKRGGGRQSRGGGGGGATPPLPTRSLRGRAQLAQRSDFLWKDNLQNYWYALAQVVSSRTSSGIAVGVPDTGL